jgi:hypothetical protein
MPDGNPPGGFIFICADLPDLRDLRESFSRRFRF